MMKVWYIIVALIALQVDLSISKCIRRGDECLDYSVISRNFEYEERQYHPILWISASETGPSLSRAQINMYRKLFRYIQGDNLKGMFVNSTRPTRTKVIPCKEETSCVPSYTMSMPIPVQLYDDPPIPTNVDLFFEKELPKRYIVRSFPGRPSEAEWFAEAQRLADLGLKDPNVEQDHYYLNWYDSPLQLFNRLNEVWLTKNTPKKAYAVIKDAKDPSAINEVCR